MVTSYFKLSSIVFVLLLFCFISLNSTDYSKNFEVYAHPVYVDSSPKQFEPLEQSPDKVIVYFSEALVLQYSQISVIDSDGNRVDDGIAENYNGDPSTITIKLNENLPKGTYTINTKVLSAVDGHVVDNSVVFSIGETIAAGLDEETISTAKSIFELISFDNSLSRVPGYIGQIIIIGAPFLYLWIRKPLSKFSHVTNQMNNTFASVRKNLLKLIIISDVLVIFSIIAMAVIQALSIGATVIDVFNTEFGEILIIRLAISIILLIVSFIFYNKYKKLQNSINNNKGLLIIIILGLAVLFTNSLISHAAALENDEIVPIFLDYFHGLAASIWIGGLVFLAFLLIPKILQLKEKEVKFRLISIIIPRFSIIILPILGSIVLTGPTLLWFIESNLFTTFGSLYGKILILKLSLAAIMIIMGAYHQFITQRRFSKILISKVVVSSDKEVITTNNNNNNNNDLSSQLNLKKFYILLRIESFVGIALLFAVSLMTNMVLPSGEITSPINDKYNNNNVFATLSNGINLIKNNNGYLTDIYTNNQKIQIELDPASLGQNTISVSFTDLNSGKNNANIENATLKLNQIEKRIGPIQLEMKKVSDGIFSTKLPISTLGIWNFEIQGKTLQPNTPNTISTFNIDIKPQLTDLEFNITEYPTPAKSLILYPVYHKPTNSIWIGDTSPGIGRILEFSINEKIYKTHKIENTNLVTLSVFDPIENNILWYVDPTESLIGKYDVTTNTSRGQYELPEMGVISGLTIDDKQNLWMSLVQANSIIKFDPKTNNFTEYKIPTQNSRPLALLFDKNNNFIWFAETIGKLGKIDIKTGNITEYPTDSNPTDSSNTKNISTNSISTTANSSFSLSEPTALLLDPKTSNIYISEHESNSIVRFNPLIESFKRYSLSDNNNNKDGLAFGMVFDMYNNIWIAQHVSDELIILDPISGKIASVKIPKQGSFVQYLATDSQGDIWFAEQRGNALGKATIKFIPSNNPQQQQQQQPSGTGQQSTNNNTITDQNNNKNIITNVVTNVSFYEIVGPLLVVAVIVITLLYINSYKKLFANLNDLNLLLIKYNKNQTKTKKR